MDLEAAAVAVRALLEALGEDPSRDGLLDTPGRVARAYAELLDGYAQSPKDVLSRDFDSDGYDGIISLRGIRFVSLCEHHMLPFIGQAAIAYLPGERRIVGVSKLARLVDIYAHRLQVQERMTRQIADAIMQELEPRGAAVLVEAEHQCMSCRGVRRPGTDMLTSSLRGVFENTEIRGEVMWLLRGTERR